MQLTERELKYISPGIYRFSHRMVGPPNLDEPENDGLIKILTELRAEVPDVSRGTNVGYIKSPEQFLDTWIKGYVDFPDTAEDWRDPGYVASRGKGFELFYVNWHPEDTHCRIGDEEMVWLDGSRLRFMMLASDINGMNDQHEYMNVGINDFNNERVLVWRGRYENRIKIPYAELPKIAQKPLRDDLHFYVWDGPDRFPFDSPNLAKSSGWVNGVWTMIGFSPEAVYSKFQNLGFVFPPVKNSPKT